jgi:hypothetical protein
MGTRVNDGWTVYEPPRHKTYANLLHGILDGFTEDCRRFARTAREARLDELHQQFGLTWDIFCQKHLGYAPPVVQAILVGVDVLGEEMPIPAELARRVGERYLAEATGSTPKGGRPKTTESVVLTQVARAKKNSVGVDSQRKLDYLATHAPDLLADVQTGILSTHAAYQRAKGQIPETPLTLLHRAWCRVPPEDRVRFVREMLTEAERAELAEELLAIETRAT